MARLRIEELIFAFRFDLEDPTVFPAVSTILYGFFPRPLRTWVGMTVG
jgi:hypothetical protein